MKSNLKWLLLVPAVAIVVGLGYAVPKLVSGSTSSDSSNSSTQASQAAKQQMDQDQQQISAYQDLVKKNPQDQLSLQKLGDTYFDLGTQQSQSGDVNDAAWNFKKAVDEYRAYLALNPGDMEVKIDLGNTYTELSMPDVALRELKAVTAAEPNNQRAWLNLGYTYLRMGKTDECKDPLQKAINLNPTNEYGKNAKSLLDQANSGAGQSNLVPTP